MKVTGIKCDNSNCNYHNDTATFEDYKNYINKPCPCCGENLLTKKDYRTCKMLMAMSNFINKHSKTPDKERETIDFSVRLDMNGTGKVSVKEINID